MTEETSGSSREQRPPLPPRPMTGASLDLQAQPTTAITPLEIQTLSFPDGSRGTFSKPDRRSDSTPGGSGRATPSTQPPASTEGNNDDSVSVTSFAPTLRPAGDIASLLAGELYRRSPAWSLLRSQSAIVPPFDKRPHGSDTLASFEHEFDALPQDTALHSMDDHRLAVWKAKLKHYMILSSAGKPIWSRHGDLDLINSSIGVVQTIISFYEGNKDPIQAFKAGDARFIVATHGPLYFVAITKLHENDSQVRAQLDALYMQILSTLTLPGLTRIFVNRPSSDLRKPLEGTESLLSSLADNFTRGSPSALLGSLECLRLKKSQRHSINNLILKHRADKLLYGLIVAGGKLVSVVRPRRHSLHPSDLQLIFNMLFESGGVKSGSGENWIPLCLPAFNNKGYLYMYVSFFDGTSGEQVQEQGEVSTNPPPSNEEEMAIILISADRESFYDLKQMRDNVAQQLAKSGSLAIIQSAARAGRPRISDIVPGSQISHFLYKSKANVQFCMSRWQPHFQEPLDRRRLMTLYHELHASSHNKHTHLKVLHQASEQATSLAWATPTFEFYCVAGPNLPRAAMTQAANKITQWAKKEEERLFIIGGGVF